ncbi:MAG: hypothetical protein ACTHJP_04595 [Rhodanobacteraceae bacterium]
MERPSRTPIMVEFPAGLVTATSRRERARAAAIGVLRAAPECITGAAIALPSTNDAEIDAGADLRRRVSLREHNPTHRAPYPSLTDTLL